MIRENWRFALLTVLVLVSLGAVFVPGTVGSADGATNLQYGLQLSGGAQLDTTLVGVTAEGVNVTRQNEVRIEEQVAGRFQNLSSLDVNARPSSDTVEVFADVQPSRLASALDVIGVSYDRVRTGVTAATRQSTVQILSSKLDAAGYAGGEVQIQRSAGQHYVSISVPNANVSDVQNLIADRGRVVISVLFPQTQGSNATYKRYPLFSGGGEEQAYRKPVSPPEMINGEPAVRLTLRQQAAENFSDALQKFGFVDRAIETGQQGICYYQQRPDDPGYCIMTELDGEVVHAAGLAPGLAQTIQSGAFVQNPRFHITAANMSQARELQISLQAGALPAPLEMANSFYIGPSFAQTTLQFSFYTGLIAVIAVSLVVYLRYGDAKVALPMIVTALSEVVIILGFMAAIQMALDLSHIAGLIAVIGTGVDDLVIIADEVMTQEVSSARVFQSRFRKALWVIGAAAVTTIIAMSPLAVLSLGNLWGFAVVTIFGVLVGVLITRPAYGDILRRLLTSH
ncbi:MAG: preprotein translocase subunit SecD [Halobacteriaceae archaeon]